MTIYWIDPLTDDRWLDFVEKHNHSSVFHTRAWLLALHKAYGFVPVTFTTTPPGAPLRNGIVFCRVSSWLTGRRLVCLPFSDHCDPLADGEAEVGQILGELGGVLKEDRLKYIEIRPITPPGNSQISGFQPCRSYILHKLDLREDLEEVKARFHKDCVLRKIRRAEKSGLGYEEGRSASLVEKFYGLQRCTRARLRVPPQPLSWFGTLAESLGGRLKIQIASMQGRPIAAILTLRHKTTLVYKYGCSDERYNQLGGIQMLLWRAIQDAKNDGAQEFDLGRTDIDNAGLLAFKNRWGAVSMPLSYFRISASAKTGFQTRSLERLSPLVPGWIMAQAGKRLYRHFA
jgi:hypothetical protein